MHKPLYLDTARVGQMSPSARNASFDFARFANEIGSGLYFNQLLSEGYSSWPDSLQRRYPGLASWQGSVDFKNRLRRVAKVHPTSNVYLASRSASLMKVASMLLSKSCRRVLTTDQCWPSYQTILRRRLCRVGGRITTIPSRKLCFNSAISVQEFVEYVVENFIQQGCDGLFLPLIDNFGIRLPVEKIVKAIRRRVRLRFVVVDAAQAIGQMPSTIGNEHFDFVVAGVHKWLRAFYTMGIAYACNPATQSFVEESLCRWSTEGRPDDPLMQYLRELESNSTKPFGETVQLVPFFVAGGALTHVLKVPVDVQPIASINRKRIANAVMLAKWRLHAPEQEAFKSRIVLASPMANSNSKQIEDALFKAGIAATTYSSGVVRLSLPDAPLGVQDEARILNAFRSVRVPIKQFSFSFDQ